MLLAFDTFDIIDIIETTSCPTRRVRYRTLPIEGAQRSGAERNAPGSGATRFLGGGIYHPPWVKASSSLEEDSGGIKGQGGMLPHRALAAHQAVSPLTAIKIAFRER